MNDGVPVQGVLVVDDRSQCGDLLVHVLSPEGFLDAGADDFLAKPFAGARQADDR